MKILLTAIAGALLCSASLAADKDCDNCNRAAMAAALACSQKAKTAEARKACDKDEDRQKQMCQLTKCKKGLF